MSNESPEVPATPPPPEEKAREIGSARITFYEDGSCLFIPAFYKDAPGSAVEKCLRLLGQNMVVSAPAMAAAHDTVRAQEIKEIGH